MPESIDYCMLKMNNLLWRCQPYRFVNCSTGYPLQVLTPLHFACSGLFPSERRSAGRALLSGSPSPVVFLFGYLLQSLLLYTRILTNKFTAAGSFSITKSFVETPQSVTSVIKFSALRWCNIQSKISM